jgi:hypothetical protein
MTSLEFNRLIARLMGENDKIQLAVPALLLRLRRAGGLFSCPLPPSGEQKC